MQSTKCKSFEMKWLARSEGRLDDADAIGMARHAENCSRCARFEREMETLEFKLTELGDESVEAPPYLKTRIMAKIEEENESSSFSLAGFFSKTLLQAAGIALTGFLLGTLVSRQQIDRIGPTQLEVDPSSMTLTLDYHAPETQDVRLVGDFNGWGKETAAVLRERINGSWVFRLTLEPGRYQYCFVVDGKKWLPDPSATGMIPDGFGGMNSVLYVKDAEGSADLTL